MSYRLDRRQFLASGAALAGATLLGTSACTPDDIVAPGRPSDPAPARLLPLDGDLPEPAVIASTGGILTAAIACSTNPAVIAGRRIRETVTYNGTFPGPTLSVRPGDMIDITFTNRIVFDQAGTKPGYGKPPRQTKTTNLHFHGMHVSPMGTADNMLLMVEAHGTQRYMFQVPLDHPAGLFWYHAHVHGLVTNHVGRGAAGMIYVSNAYTDNIASLGIRRRLMMLQQAYLEPDRYTIISDDGERENDDLALSLINGQLMPDILMRPGEPQVWSLLNGSTSAFYMLRLEGHTFDVIADDGVPLRTPRLNQETLLMASGKRLEVIVRGSSTAGKYTLSYDEHFQGVDAWPEKSVAKVIVKGPRVERRQPSRCRRLMVIRRSLGCNGSRFTQANDCLRTGRQRRGGRVWPLHDERSRVGPEHQRMDQHAWHNRGMVHPQRHGAGSSLPRARESISDHCSQRITGDCRWIAGRRHLSAFRLTHCANAIYRLRRRAGSDALPHPRP